LTCSRRMNAKQVLKQVSGSEQWHLLITSSSMRYSHCIFRIIIPIMLLTSKWWVESRWSLLLRSLLIEKGPRKGCFVVLQFQHNLFMWKWLSPQLYWGFKRTLKLEDK
jgi:hypothetical protein